jgi:hypothetical protein
LLAAGRFFAIGAAADVSSGAFSSASSAGSSEPHCRGAEGGERSSAALV